MKITPEVFTGPHHGPGVITEIDGPFIVIEWREREQNDPNNPTFPKRLIPFSAITCIDRPLTGPMLPLYVVYYQGPFGETEFAFLLEAKSLLKVESDFKDSFLRRWKIYLLSQEK